MFIPIFAGLNCIVQVAIFSAELLFLRSITSSAFLLPVAVAFLSETRQVLVLDRRQCQVIVLSEDGEVSPLLCVYMDIG